MGILTLVHRDVSPGFELFRQSITSLSFPDAARHSYHHHCKGSDTINISWLVKITTVSRLTCQEVHIQQLVQL